MVSKRQDSVTSEVVSFSTHSQNDWKNVSSYVDAFAVFPEIVTSSEVVGDGFVKLDKKEAIDREFLILDWKFITDKSTMREFASIRCINPYNARFRLTDGSTGIYQQLKEIQAQGITGGIHCEKGLRVSEYTYEDEKGNKSTAKTYYIA